MPKSLRLLIYYLPLLLALNSSGQVIYFDKTYDNQNLTERCSNVLLKEDGNYFFSTSSIFFNPGWGGSLNYYAIDDYGEVLTDTSTYIDSSRYEIGYIAATSDDNFVNFYSFAAPNLNYNFSLSKVTSEGIEIWTQEYGDTALTNSARHVIETFDKGFLLVGQSYDTADGDIHVIKTDSSGNLEWEKSYGGNDFEAGLSGVQTPDRGFFILGWTRSFGSGERDFYLIKTDSVGNQEWQKTYGGNDMESGWGIVELADDNYLLSGAKVSSGLDRGWLIKIEPNGDIIWQKNYYHGSNITNEFFWSKELPNKSIVVVGLTNNSTQGDAGWLVKTDSAGNLLWQRKYNFNNFTDLFYDVLPTSDGGFLLSGQCINTANNISQDAWLLKVDSLGCAYENCTVGIEEESKKVMVDVYPNPTSEILNIELQESNKIYEVEITDINGQVVYKSEIGNQKSEVSVSGYANGIYLLTLENEEQRTSLKIVIQH